ncbi:alpha/beta fold hydrolase [Streptomyces graminilatus]|uniref:alpha/beta fold hydrolase n=1 Tax=Streptomyces graminilatus TaxID=1464070 RepID=UPI00240F620C|nr:alpha/beta hydrolase [Streptomyces graminilatus]
MVADLAPVYRYDQRGTGQSPWRGRHSFARHVDDLVELLDAWDVPRAVLVGHSYGTDLASRFCLTHPDRVAAMLLMCGPFVGDWRTGDRAERGRRMSAAQLEGLRALEESPHRTEEQEVELLTLAWFTDHADPERGWHWAAQGARRRRPVNWAMNSELGKAGRADPLDAHLDELRACLPARAELLGGADDPRTSPGWSSPTPCVRTFGDSCKARWAHRASTGSPVGLVPRCRHRRRTGVEMVLEPGRSPECSPDAEAAFVRSCAPMSIRPRLRAPYKAP